MPGGRPVDAASTSGWPPIGVAHAVVVMEQRGTERQLTVFMAAEKTIGVTCHPIANVDGSWLVGSISTMLLVAAAIGLLQHS